jgi:hypothetical protein
MLSAANRLRLGAAIPRGVFNKERNDPKFQLMIPTFILTSFARFSNISQFGQKHPKTFQYILVNPC